MIYLLFITYFSYVNSRIWSITLLTFDKSPIMKKYLVFVFIFTLLSNLAYSQGPGSRNRSFIIGAGTGAAFYFGDLAKDGTFRFVKPNFALSARYNFYDRFSVESQITWFMLTGNDKYDPIKERRNLRFSSNNFELNLLAHISLFQEAIRFYQRPLANPYMYFGIGLVNFNPTTTLDGEKYKLRKLETEGPDHSYGAFTMSVPLGLGVKFRASPFININIDGGFRFVLSDYLDDVSSGVYPDPTSFNNEVARKLSDRSGEIGVSPTFSERGLMVRGNPNEKDAYLILNVKVEYFFGSVNSPRGRSSGFRPVRHRKPKAYRPKKIKRRR